MPSSAIKHRKNKVSEEIVCTNCNDDLSAIGSLNPKHLWQHFKSEHISFKLICAYYFFEYVRPQGIIPALDILPWAQLCIVLSGLAWLMDPKKTFHFSGAFASLFLFYFVAVASAIFAVFPEISWANIPLIHNWIIIIFVTVAIVNTRTRFFILMIVFLLASFKLSFFGAKTFAMRGFSFAGWGISGPPGFFQNSGEYAIQMLIFTPLMWFFALSLRGHVKKWLFRLLIFAAATGAISVIAASSRGAQLGLVVELFLVFLISRISIKSLIIAMLTCVAAYFLMPEAQIERFSTAGEDKTSQTRLAYWENGLEILKDNPYLGIGLENFREYHAKFYHEDVKHLTHRKEVIHNTTLQVATGTGYIGIFSFFLIIYLQLKTANNIRRNAASIPAANCFDANMAQGLRIGMWGFLVAAQFVSVAFYPFLWIQLALTLSLANIVRASDRPKKHRLQR